MTQKEVLEVLEEMFDMEEGELEADAMLDDVEEWDSLSALYLMSYAKKELQKQLTTEEIKGFKTVQDICDYIMN